MKYLYNNLLIFLIMIASQSYSQDLLYTSHFTGPGENIPFKVAIDADNNLYVIGTFTDTVYQHPFGLRSFNSSVDDFIVKYSATGEIQWLKQIGSTGADLATGIRISSDGYLYILGHFLGTCFFDDSSLTSSGNADIFLAKYNRSGSLIWAKNIGQGVGTTAQYSNAMAIDINDNILITGYYQTSIVFDDTTLTANGYRTMFMAQFDSSGSLNWAKNLYGQNNTNRLYSINTNDTAYYFAGYFTSTLYLDVDTFTGEAATKDMFIYATNLNGKGAWARTMHGSGDDYLTSITSDNNGNVYSGGYYSSPSLTIDSTKSESSSLPVSNEGGTDIFFVKYSQQGNLLWFNTPGSTGDDKILRSVFKNGNFIVSGEFGGTMTVDNETISPVGGEDVLGLVYDSFDNLVYIVPIGGTANELGETSEIDNDGNFIFIGDFRSVEIYFGDEDTLYNNDITGTTKDMFIAKYNKMSVDMVVTEPSCYGDADGSISVTPRGIGEEPFGYQWAHGPTSQNVSGLSTGWYKVTVTDNTGYVVVDSAFVDQPDSIHIELTDTSDVSCFNGNDGTIDITVTGGTTPYFYTWTTTDGSGLYSTNQDQFTLTAGTYSVKVRGYNPCYDSLKNIVIHEPTPIVVTGIVDTVSAEGAGDGAIDITVTGGVAPYGYLWSNDSTTEDIDSLDGGDYGVTVTDNHGCTKDTSFFVYEPNVLLITYSKTHVSCFGECDGSVNVTVTGGIPGYTYVWKIQGETDTIYTGQDTSGLCENTYILTVRDNDGAGAPNNKTIVITEPSELTNPVLVTGISCYGEKDGAINATPMGGTTPRYHHWIMIGNPSFNRYTEDISDLEQGIYTDTCRDAHGCMVVSQGVVTEPPALVISDLDDDDISCYIGQNDGSICLTITGGTPSYSYLWSNGKTTSCITLLPAGDYSCQIKDQHNCGLNTGSISISRPPQISLANRELYEITCNGLGDGWVVIYPSGGTGDITIDWTGPVSGTGDTLLNMPPGLYDLIATDINNCSVEDTLTMTQPEIVMVSLIDSLNITCRDDSTGEIDIEAVGGTAGVDYVYTWSTADGGGLVPGAQDQHTLTAGTYKLIVTDDRLCADSLTTLLTEPATRVTPIEKTGGHGDVSCNGGSDGIIAASAYDGLAPYEFSINGMDWSTDSTFTGLIADTYTIWVRDATPCENSLTNLVITEPPVIEIDTITIDSTSAFGVADGQITIIAHGGTDTLFYTLTPGNSNNITGLFTGLGQGDYTVTITDVNNCGPEIYGPMGVREPVRVDEMISRSNINVYPNPTKGKTNISLLRYEKPEVFIELINANGQVVYEKLFKGMNDHYLVEVDLTAQPAGVYLLKINGIHTGIPVIVE